MSLHQARCLPLAGRRSTARLALAVHTHRIAGLVFRSSGLLTLGTGVRHTRGRYPFAAMTAPGQFTADDFSREDLDLSAVWVPTGLSTVQARLSHTRESHDQIPTRNVSGLTASLRWNYQPTGKLALSAEAARDTGAVAAFYRISAGSDALASRSGLSSMLQLAITFQATSAIQLESRARVLQRRLVRTTVAPGEVISSPDGADRSTELKLGLSYAPAPHWLLGCNLQHEQRAASSSVSYPYRSTVAACSVQVRAS